MALRKRKRTLKLEFECASCQYPFSQTIKRVFVDLYTLENREEAEKRGETPYIIPERIVCPRCNAVDQYKFGPMSYMHLIGSMVSLVGNIKSDDDPIQYMRFTLHDNTPMHPHTALKMYEKKVADQPDDTLLRLRYAATLRTLGYFDEAETNYRQILTQIPFQSEALINLGIIAGKKGDKKAARQLFQQLLDHPDPDLPEYEDYALGANDFLANMRLLDEYEWIQSQATKVTPKALPDIRPKTTKAKNPRLKSSRPPKTKKRRKKRR